MTTSDTQGGTTGDAHGGTPYGGAAYGSTAYRVSDAERERTVDALRGHYEGGRLDLDEFNRRLDRTYAATYTHELSAVVADLPGPRVFAAPVPATPPPPPPGRSGTGRVLAIVGLVFGALIGLGWLLAIVHAHPVITLLLVVALVAVLVIKRPFRGRTGGA